MLSRIVILFLFVSLVFGDCRKCYRNCAAKHDTVDAVDACVTGCRFSVGLNSRTDSSGVNVDCMNKCLNYEDPKLKEACYDGCIYIAPAEIRRLDNDSTSLFDSLVSPVISRFISLFLSNSDNASQENPVYVRETHIRVLIPDYVSGVDKPSNLIDGDVQVEPNVVPDTIDVPSDSFQILPLAPTPGDAKPYGFAPALCRRANVFFHHLATHPLYLVLIVLVFITSVSLLFFACARLNAHRARLAIYKRQYQRMPAFFRPASVKVSLLTPQPTSEDMEAPELPEKTPIV